METGPVVKAPIGAGLPSLMGPAQDIGGVTAKAMWGAAAAVPSVASQLGKTGFAAGVPELLAAYERIRASVSARLRPGQFAYDAKLNDLFPREGDPAVPFYTTDAGRRVLIDGTVREWRGETREVISPIRVQRPDGSLTPHKIGEIAWMGEKEALEALDSAIKAYDNGRGEWPTMTLKERGAALTKFIERVKTRRENLVQLLMWEVGKTRDDAEKEFDRTVEYMEQSIAAAIEMSENADEIEASGGFIRKAFPDAIGVVLCMGPFNYPWNEAFGTSAFPALLMGNTVLYKPAKKGQLLISEILDIFAETLPKGVISGVSGDGATVITPLMKSGKLNGFHFIGSNTVADRILSKAPNRPNIKVILGLGAKNAGVVLPGANLDEAAEKGAGGALSYNGQRCTALKAFYVHRSDAQSFAEKMAARVAKLKIDMPWIKGAKITPLPEDDKIKWMKEYVEDALLKGAEIMNDGGGSYNDTIFNPAVLFPVTRDMRIANEEQFGPVVPIIVYDDIEEVYEHVVSLPYRQQAAVLGNPTTPAMFATVSLLTSLNQRTNVNAQPQRGPDNWSFGARDEVMLSIGEALLEFSKPGQVVLADNPANREVLKSWTYDGILKARRRVAAKGSSAQADADSGGDETGEQGGEPGER